MRVKITDDYRLDIRVTDHHRTKYGCSMAEYLHTVAFMNGDEGDDETSNGMGDWSIRYGRRIMAGNDYGFVVCVRFDTVEEAIEAIESDRQAFTYCLECDHYCHDYDEDTVEGNCECDCHIDTGAY